MTACLYHPSDPAYQGENAEYYTEQFQAVLITDLEDLSEPEDRVPFVATIKIIYRAPWYGGRFVEEVEVIAHVTQEIPHDLQDQAVSEVDATFSKWEWAEGINVTYSNFL